MRLRSTEGAGLALLRVSLTKTQRGKKMAWIGKDGKDDVAKLAVLGGSQVVKALSVVPGMSTLTTTSRYHRVDYSLANTPNLDVVNEHVDFVERLTLVGFIDSYGGNDPRSPFIIVQYEDAAMAEALGKASPLVTQAGATVKISAI